MGRLFLSWISVLAAASFCEKIRELGVYCEILPPDTLPSASKCAGLS